MKLEPTEQQIKQAKTETAKTVVGTGMVTSGGAGAVVSCLLYPSLIAVWTVTLVVIVALVVMTKTVNTIYQHKVRQLTVSEEDRLKYNKALRLKFSVFWRTEKISSLERYPSLNENKMHSHMTSVKKDKRQLNKAGYETETSSMLLWNGKTREF